MTTDPTNAATARTAAPATAVHLPRGDMRVRWDLLPGGMTPGTTRGVFNGIAATSAMVNMLVLPPGQTSPPHTFDAEHIVIQLQGETEWTVGDERYLLRDEDFLFIPARALYSFTNPGTVDAYFVDVAAKTDRWPPAMSYDDDHELNSSDLDVFNTTTQSTPPDH